MPDEIPEPLYDEEEEPRQVRSRGEIKWRSRLLYVSKALIGETVAVRPRPDGSQLIRFAAVPLILIGQDGKPSRLGPGRPPRPKPGDTTENLSTM
jgi:hypothetical protein